MKRQGNVGRKRREVERETGRREKWSGEDMNG